MESSIDSFCLNDIRWYAMLLGICWADDREYSRKRVEHGDSARLALRLVHLLRW